MAISTYSELQTAIAARLGRSDLTSEIPDFIVQAEADFNASLRCRQMEQRAYATATEYMALPTDYLELRRIHLQGTPHDLVMLASVSDADNYSEATGTPSHYALVGNQLQLMPAPDGTYTVEIDYYQAIPPLASNSTNWLLSASPSVYIFGAMVHALVRIQDDARALGAQQALQGAINTLQRSDKVQRWSGSRLAARAA